MTLVSTQRTWSYHHKFVYESIGKANRLIVCDVHVLMMYIFLESYMYIKPIVHL